jgi:phage baseplate assembly protein W
VELFKTRTGGDDMMRDYGAKLKPAGDKSTDKADDKPAE